MTFPIRRPIIPESGIFPAAVRYHVSRNYVPRARHLALPRSTHKLCSAWLQLVGAGWDLIETALPASQPAPWPATKNLASRDGDPLL